MRKGARRGRALLVLLIGVAAVAGILLVPRQGTVGTVDAVIVLGGGGGERLALGRGLAEERGIPLVLSAEAIDEGVAAGLGCGEDVVCLQPEPVNTAGEARSSRTLADERGWDRVAVATSTYHVNRTRMLFRQCHGDRADVIGAPADGSLVTDVYRYGRELAARIMGAMVRTAC